MQKHPPQAPIEIALQLGGGYCGQLWLPLAVFSGRLTTNFMFLRGTVAGLRGHNSATEEDATKVIKVVAQRIPPISRRLIHQFILVIV